MTLQRSSCRERRRAAVADQVKAKWKRCSQRLRAKVWGTHDRAKADLGLPGRRHDHKLRELIKFGMEAGPLGLRGRRRRAGDGGARSRESPRASRGRCGSTPPRCWTWTASRPSRRSAGTIRTSRRIIFGRDLRPTAWARHRSSAAPTAISRRGRRSRDSGERHRPCGIEAAAANRAN